MSASVKRQPICFSLGGQMFHIAHRAAAEEYVGMRNGQIRARASDPAAVARALITAEIRSNEAPPLN